MENIKKYFIKLNTKQVEQFTALDELYKYWNTKINVISRRDIDNLYLHHVLHSLAIAKVINFISGTAVLDVGTGGGFPGLPLAIVYPDVNFLLVDSVGKKLQVVEAICQDINIRNVRTSHLRAEEIDEQFDFAVARAVTRLDTMWSWVGSKIKADCQNSLPNGLLYLKGGDISNEIPQNTYIRRWELSQIFNEPYFSEKALVLLSSFNAQ